MLLRGIAFGNEVWSDKEVPETHHNEKDFERVKTMGMNVVRFYLNYKTFENDAAPYQYKQTGWQWIEKNIAWAKKYGVYLILNMHAPQGGYQSQGSGDALWNIPENQNRLTALWKAIAARYKNESQIIGFGPLNEPVPSNNILQWQQLAQRITNEVRSVDENHIFFIEKAIWVKGQPETADFNFPRVTDKNLVYEFHFYDPIAYTHQLFSWANLGDGGKYPDESVISYSNSNWYTATFNNPALPPGIQNWQYFEGEKFKISDPKIKIGIPALVGASVTGKVFFDDIEIKEYAPDGTFSQTMLKSTMEDGSGWNFWSKNNSGKAGWTNETGRNDLFCLFIEGATDDCNYANYGNAFIPKQGYSYQVNGWMKGENINNSAGCRMRIDFLSTNDPVFGRNKAYLEFLLKKFTVWAKNRNVPLYMGEFGAGIHCFQNNKGGLQWVGDMLDIAKTENLNFSYHSYHEDSFGLYFGDGTLPDQSNANQPLIDLFISKLK